jgi:hypothetical protein
MFAMYFIDSRHSWCEWVFHCNNVLYVLDREVQWEVQPLYPIYREINHARPRQDHGMTSTNICTTYITYVKSTSQEWMINSMRIKLMANFDKVLLSMERLFLPDSSSNPLWDQNTWYLYWKTWTIWEYHSENISSRQYFGEAKKKGFHENNQKFEYQDIRVLTLKGEFVIQVHRKNPRWYF